MEKTQEEIVEVAASFSYKLNVGNYETRDFFGSMKRSCPISQFSETYQNAYELCRQEVFRAVEDYQKLFEKPAPKPRAKVASIERFEKTFEPRDAFPEN